MRYIGAGGTRTRDQALDTLERMIESYRARGYGQLGVERKEDGAFLGRCGLLVWDPTTWTITEQVDGPLEVEIGYLLGREHWGNGYATESALAVRDWALARARARAADRAHLSEQHSLRPRRREAGHGAGG